jgi:hypothetical protein
MLKEQMAAAQVAQSELAKYLRVPAPLRRVQESLRRRTGDRRRRAGVDVASSASRTPPISLDITDEQVSRHHPLLARTRDCLTGQPLLPEPLFALFVRGAPHMSL